MANFQGFQVETPQEVLKRLEAQRTQMIGSNNPLLIQQAIYGRAFDQIFGNPEVRAAKKSQEKIAEAMSQAPEGANELETEMLRLSRVRDAISDLNPDLADQIRARLVELEGERMERNKLLADQRKAEAEYQGKVVNVAQDVNASNTWFKEGRDPVEVLATDSKTQDALRAEGWTQTNPKVGGSSTNVKVDVHNAPPKDAREAVSFGLSALKNLERMDELTGKLGGLFDESGLPRPLALIEWAGGKLGVDQAAVEWNRLEEFAKADVQSIIRGTPSNRDALVYEALIPTFWEPAAVKKAKIKALRSAQADLVRNNVAYFKGTKEAIPPELVERAKALRVNVADIAAIDSVVAEKNAMRIAAEAQSSVMKEVYGAPKGAKAGEDQEARRKALRDRYNRMNQSGN